MKRDFVLYYSALRIAYNFIPKNACSSIKASLAFANDGAVCKISPHELDCLYAHKPADFGEGWRKIVALRDPFDRLVSAYLDKIAKPLEAANKELVRWLFLRCEGREPIGDESITFRQFWSWVREQRSENLDAHWLPQTKMIEFTDYDAVLNVNFLARDWNRFGLDGVAKLQSFLEHATASNIDFASDLTNMPGNFLFGFRVTTGSFPPRRCFADPSIMSEVRDFYAADYDLLLNSNKLLKHELDG